MPHIVYLAAALLCQWPGCAFRIELIDIQLELMIDTAFYTQAMAEWGPARRFLTLSVVVLGTGSMCSLDCKRKKRLVMRPRLACRFCRMIGTCTLILLEFQWRGSSL